MANKTKMVVGKWTGNKVQSEQIFLGQSVAFHTSSE